MSLNPDQLLDLVVATLATYQYPLDKAWALRDQLHGLGLTDPTRIADQDVAEVGNLLKAAGYDRGGITYIIAPRLISLMQAAQSGALDPLADHASRGDHDAFKSHLASVKGFGPKSAAVAWELMRSETT